MALDGRNYAMLIEDMDDTPIQTMLLRLIFPRTKQQPTSQFHSPIT